MGTHTTKLQPGRIGNINRIEVYTNLTDTIQCLRDFPAMEQWETLPPSSGIASRWQLTLESGWWAHIIHSPELTVCALICTHTMRITTIIGWQLRSARIATHAQRALLEFTLSRRTQSFRCSSHDTHHSNTALFIFAPPWFSVMHSVADGTYATHTCMCGTVLLCAVPHWKGGSPDLPAVSPVCSHPVRSPSI